MQLYKVKYHLFCTQNYSYIIYYSIDELLIKNRTSSIDGYYPPLSTIPVFRGFPLQARIAHSTKALKDFQGLHPFMCFFISFVILTMLKRIHFTHHALPYLISTYWALCGNLQLNLMLQICHMWTRKVCIQLSPGITSELYQNKSKNGHLPDAYALGVSLHEATTETLNILLYFKT